MSHLQICSIGLQSSRRSGSQEWRQWTRRLEVKAVGNKIQAVVKQRFSAAPERVYDAWLSEEMVRVWLAASLRECGLAGDLKRIEIDARLGGKFFFSDQRGEVEARHWGNY